ncbi:MAG: nucleotidyl transferase AbiEii/AbiGii toxin family protein [Bdellovibrionales bacterium]|nr:nucleotidyl transferase AbiEii/AbiGii toxin family protein [Bdellovibrionales bacterium]
MDSKDIRFQILQALSQDEELYDALVFKGGNALQLIHGIGDRASLDLDFSLAEDFPDWEAVGRRLEKNLEDFFAVKGVRVFDFRFYKRPLEPSNPRWGGYAAEFKLIAREKFTELKKNIEDVRRQAIRVLPYLPNTTFKIEISKFECVERSEIADIEDGSLRVYAPELIAAEKLRAICQQMDAYEHQNSAAPRPRDFYDIFSICQARALNLRSPTFVELLDPVFAAKEVPLQFIAAIRDEFDLHASGWDGVASSIRNPEEFSFYFDYVVERLPDSKTLGIEELP